jgi:ABC-type glycerol-3-phosphate transport system permease component
VGSHTVGDVLAVPPPVLPGDRFLENMATAWTKGNLGRLFLNSFVVAIGITVGKIAVSMLSAFAIAYFRFRFRMLAFWLIFMSLCCRSRCASCRPTRRSPTSPCRCSGWPTSPGSRSRSTGT